MKYFYSFLVLNGLLLIGYQLFSSANSIDTNDDYTIHTYTKQFANIYIVECRGRYLMIDAGLPNDHENILSFLEKHNISPEAIEYLILTHAHPDHAGNAAYFQQSFGTTIIAGKGDLEMIKNGGFDKNLCPKGIQGKIIKATIASQRYETFTPDILVENEMDLKEIGWQGKIQTFRSHTSGSLTIFMSDMVFVGDLIKGQNLNKQKPTFHIFMCDLSKNIANLRTITENEKAQKWYLGHFGPLNREDVLEFISEFEPSPQSSPLKGKGSLK